MGVILSVAVFYLCGLGSRGSQNLVKTMKPSEKLTRACGRVLDLDCEAVAVGRLPGTGEPAQPPTVVERTELAVVPNALQRQSPNPAAGPSRDTTRALLCFCSFLFSFTIVTTP